MKRRNFLLTGAGLVGALTLTPATPASAFPGDEDCTVTDTCDSAVATFCDSHVLEGYDLVGDCEADILNDEVPAYNPFVPPPAPAGWGAGVTDEVEP